MCDEKSLLYARATAIDADSAAIGMALSMDRIKAIRNLNGENELILRTELQKARAYLNQLSVLLGRIEEHAAMAMSEQEVA